MLSETAVVVAFSMNIVSIYTVECTYCICCFRLNDCLAVVCSFISTWYLLFVCCLFMVIIDVHS